MVQCRAKSASPKLMKEEVKEAMKGTVKWFNEKKGYGFITGDDGADYFVHYTDIVADGFKTLKNGASVEFEVKVGEKGSEATEVKLLA